MKKIMPSPQTTLPPKNIDKGEKMLRHRNDQHFNRQLAVALALEVVPKLMETGCELVRGKNYRCNLEAESAFAARRHREEMEKAGLMSQYRRENGETMSQEVRDEYDREFLNQMRGKIG